MTKIHGKYFLLEEMGSEDLKTYLAYGYSFLYLYESLKKSDRERFLEKFHEETHWLTASFPKIIKNR